MSCEYCEEGRTLFASAEGRACDIDDISVERLCVLGKEGRRKLYRDGTGYRTSVDDGGKLIPFYDWCIEHVGYSSLRCGMTKSEFIAYFEPEFREEYDELVNEWKAGQE